MRLLCVGWKEKIGANGAGAQKSGRLGRVLWRLAWAPCKSGLSCRTNDRAAKKRTFNPRGAPSDMKPRRYPPPWTVDEAPESICVSDSNGQALAFVGQTVKHTNAPL